MRQKQYRQPPRRRHRRPRRRRARGPAGIFLSAIIMLVVFFGASLFFRVRSIEVNGAVKCDPLEILSLSGVSDGDFLFYINRRAARRAILSDQAYAETVSVRVRFPQTVSIELTECTALAQLRSGSEYWVIDRRGKLLEVTRDRPALPEITGLNLLVPLTGTGMEVGAGNEYKVAPLLELLDLLDGRGITADTIEYDTVRGISFTYLGRFNVVVGLPEYLGHKLDRLEHYVNEELEPNAAGTIYLPEEGGRVGRFVPR